jgi:chromosome segregation ATPase
MDSQEILKSLSNLEQKLQSIESARQQVERTVNAYEGAKAQLSVLTQDFTDIYQELKKVLDDIQNSKSIASTEVSDKADVVFKALQTRITSLEQATKDIKENFENACKTANENFSKTIEKSGKDLTAEMEANINKTREATVKEIEKASGIIVGFRTAVDELKEDYNKALSESSENQKTVITQIATDFSKSVDQYIDSMKTVRVEMESLLEKYNYLTTRIEDVLKEVQGSIESALAHFSRTVDANTQATVALGQNLESQISSSFSQLMDASKKSHKLILILVVGLIISIILNILAVVKVI